MRAEIFGAVLLVGGVVLGVRHWEGARAEYDAEVLAADALQSANTAPEMASLTSSGYGREVRITAARDHQFYVTAGVNHRAAEFLVDTGAAYVALRESDAAKAGIYTTWADFTYPVRTANGETKAALVTIDMIEIENVRVENIKAFVLPDAQLGVNLLGMSFLNELESVEARKGVLVLRG